MDETLARIVIGNAARATREIGNLAPLLKQHADPVAYEEIKPGIGEVVYEIYEAILGPVFARFPDLKAEFDQNVERYGVGS